MSTSTRAKTITGINAVAACAGITILILGNGWARILAAIALVAGLAGLALTRTSH